MFYVTFSRGRDEVVGPTIGPFESVNIFYDTLRVAPGGDEVARMRRDGDWYLTPAGVSLVEPQPGLANQPFSDITIHP